MSTSRVDSLWHGLMVGLIGYVTIAASVSLGDLLLGRSFFYTVSLLGEWLFYDLRDPADLRVWPGAVFAYNGLHLITFLGFGLVASWLATMSEKGPLYWYAGLVMFLFVFVHMFASVLLMTEPLRREIPFALVLIPSLLSVGAMSLYLWRTHPRLQLEMTEWVDEDDSPDTHPQPHGRA